MRLDTFKYLFVTIDYAKRSLQGFAHVAPIALYLVVDTEANGFRLELISFFRQLALNIAG